MRNRCLRGALVATGLTALAACGTIVTSATVESTAPIAERAPSGAPTTTRPVPTGATTTAAGTTTVVADATTSADAGTTTTVAPVSAEPPPTTVLPTLASIPNAPATTVKPTADRAVLVQRLFNTIGYPLNDTEAACLAAHTPQQVLDALAASGDAAVEGTIAAGLVQSLAQCEPESFLAEQDDITMQDYDIDANAARCVTKALDTAAVGDATIALAYWEGTTRLTSALQQQLVTALTPCVGKAKATEIVTT